MNRINLVNGIKSTLTKYKEAFAANDLFVVNNLDGSKTSIFENGDFKLVNDFFEANPQFSGNYVIHFDSNPVWSMAYYGSFISGFPFDFGFPFDGIKKFLTEALLVKPVSSSDDFSLRGPRSLFSEESDLSYTALNLIGSPIDDFLLYESISLNNKDKDIVYKARFLGGFINKNGWSKFLQ